MNKMDNLNIDDVINLFLNNSEILLRATTRKQGDLICTRGSTKISNICKSLYSTRCENTTSSFNLFFQNETYFYENPFTIKIGKGTDIELILKNKKEQKYNENDYLDNYLRPLNELCDYVLKKDESAIYTFSFGGPSKYLFFEEDNLVGHVYNILRIKINENSFKNYIVQGYIYKFSPICIGIDDEILKDFLRIFYAIKHYSSFIIDKFDNYDDYLIPGHIIDNQIIYTMFYYNVQDNKKMVNPWFNEKFHQLFREYYYNPFKTNLINKELGTSDNETRHYIFVEISIATINPIVIIYYNMLNFLYVYYHTISYDIYIFKLIQLITNQKNKNEYEYPIQYKYFIDEFNKDVKIDGELIIDEKNKYQYQYMNPTKYSDDKLNTSNSNMIAFWENNFFIRFSYILSDSHIILSDTINNTQENSNFLFDLYSTLLYSAKTSILNFNNKIEKINCSDPYIINDVRIKKIFNDNVICKYILKKININEVSNILQKIFLPHHFLINSLDIYDYFNNDSCKIYDILTKILIEIQNIFDMYSKEYIDSIFTYNMINFLNNITYVDYIKYGNNDKIKKLYNDVNRLFDNSFSWIVEQGIETRSDGTLINGYNPYKLNSLSNIIIIAIGFYLIEKISNTLLTFYNLEKNENSTNDYYNFYFSYDDCIKMFYSTDNPKINNSIVIVFNFFKPMIENHYNRINIEPVIKSYGIYIDTIKRILLNHTNFSEENVINKVKNILF